MSKNQRVIEYGFIINFVLSIYGMFYYLVLDEIYVKEIRKFLKYKIDMINMS